MSRCVACGHAMHEQFRSYPGRWICFHPHRREISNRGKFTYPENNNPRVIIYQTPVADYDCPERHRQSLEEAKTPVWCYFEAVERAQKEQPGFDPDKQRKILWPK